MNPIAFPALTENMQTLGLLMFACIALVYVLYSSFLFYHWYAYGTSRRANSIAVATYLLTTVPLLVIMLSSVYFL